MDISDIVAAASAGKWILVAALVVGTLVRLTKSDNKFPINIPPRLRFWLSIGLGVLSGVLMKVSTGMRWKAALIAGLGSGITAVLGQNAIIDSIFGGKEIPVPGLMKIPPADPDSGKAVVAPVAAPVAPPADEKVPETVDSEGVPTNPSKRPPVPPVVGMLIMAFLVGFLGCSATQKQVIHAGLDVLSYACVLEHAALTNPEVAKICKIEEALLPALEELLKAHRVEVAKARRDTAPGPCSSAASSASIAPSASVKK